MPLKNLMYHCFEKFFYTLNISHFLIFNCQKQYGIYSVIIININLDTDFKIFMTNSKIEVNFEFVNILQLSEDMGQRFMNLLIISGCLGSLSMC